MNSPHDSQPSVASYIRTPYYNMPVSWVLKSMDAKQLRDQYCGECGRPFMSISDKVVRVYDGNIPVDKLRLEERVIEARCKYHYCKQYYRIEV